MPHDPPPDKRPGGTIEIPGQIARTRRNPASQTIILRASQCSSAAQKGASPAILRMSHFPVKSGKSATFAPRRGLTGGLPDVGTDGPLWRELIRDPRIGPWRSQIAFKAPSLPYQSMLGLALPRKYQGIDPDGAFKTSGENHRHPSQSIRQGSQANHR